MVDVFCLKPIKADHESWPRSCVESRIEWVKVWAYNSDEARYKVSNATDVSEIPKKPAKHRYDKIIYVESPWMLSDVTSCELDRSDPRPGNYILLSDGRQLPFK